MSRDAIQRWAPIWIGALGILITVGGWIYTRATMDENTRQLQRSHEALVSRIGQIEAQGTPHGMQTRWIVDNHTRELAEVRAHAKEINAEVRDQGKILADVRKDVSFMADWVREMKQKGVAQ